jgi:hypothetical protein
LGCCIECGGDIEDSNKLLCKHCGGEKCDMCGENCDSDHYIIDDDGYIYCIKCYHKYHVFCKRCGEHHYKDSDSYITTVDDTIYCESCAKHEGYFKCDDCLEWHHNDNIYTDQSDCTLCEPCVQEYTLCPDCDCYHKTSDMITTHEGMVCKECLKYDYTKCGNCEQYYKTENGCCITIDDLVS